VALVLAVLAQAVRQILAALPLNGVAVFYQTDVRLAEKGQVSKAFLVLKAAQEVPQAGLAGRWLWDASILGCPKQWLKRDERSFEFPSALRILTRRVSGPAQVRLKWHKIVHFGTIDQPTWNAVQFTHLLCFAKGPPEVARVGCQGPDDEVVDLGSTIPDVLERGPKPSLRKGACCGPGMFWKSGSLLFFFGQRFTFLPSKLAGDGLKLCSLEMGIMGQV